MVGQAGQRQTDVWPMFGHRKGADVNHHYNDIRSRIPEPPSWWDENATPRYGTFTPDDTASIHADEIVFLRIACQNCEREFDVCMTWGRSDAVLRKVRPLSERVPERAIHYGDPPNIDCCPAGPTMNSVPLRVLEFWKKAPFSADGPRWERVPGLEVIVTPDWATEA